VRAAGITAALSSSFHLGFRATSKPHTAVCSCRMKKKKSGKEPGLVHVPY
jgi:hypothetical protein